MSFALRVLQAEFGDCLILEWGSRSALRFALIDGGPRGTYARHLRSVLESLTDGEVSLDLVVLSHVDSDHVAGLVEWLADIKQGREAGQPPDVNIGALWHNSFARTIDTPSRSLEGAISSMRTGLTGFARTPAALALQGIADGNELSQLATVLGIRRNPGFTEDLICVDEVDEPVEVNGLSLTIVGPTLANLEQLRAEWLAWLESHRSEDLSAPGVMARLDRSIPNLSSIMFLARAEGRSVLLTGDGRGDHLLEGLSLAGLLDSDGHVHVDVFKLPHHGSNRNVTKELFERITADTYVISANGRHGNPDFDTLEWLVEAAQARGRSFHLVLTNETADIRRLLARHPPDALQVTILPPETSELRITLSEE